MHSLKCVIFQVLIPCRGPQLPAKSLFSMNVINLNLKNTFIIQFVFSLYIKVPHNFLREKRSFPSKKNLQYQQLGISKAPLTLGPSSEVHTGRLSSISYQSHWYPTKNFPQPHLNMSHLKQTWHLQHSKVYNALISDSIWTHSDSNLIWLLFNTWGLWIYVKSSDIWRPVWVSGDHRAPALQMKSLSWGYERAVPLAPLSCQHLCHNTPSILYP